MGKYSVFKGKFDGVFVKRTPCALGRRDDIPGILVNTNTNFSSHCIIDAIDRFENY
jgi:hypothetical protein